MEAAFADTVRRIASSEHDDWPNVMIVGSGDRAESARRGTDALLEALKASSGRTPAFDMSVSDPESLGLATKMASSAGLLSEGKKRPLCVMRGLERLSRDTAQVMKTVLSGCHWWICSAGTVGGPVSAALGMCLLLRAPPAPENASPVSLLGPGDVRAAWASGARVEDIVEGFKALALRLLSEREAFARTAQLDVDLKRNARPLLLSSIIEDAVADVLERHHIASQSSLS